MNREGRNEKNKIKSSRATDCKQQHIALYRREYKLHSTLLGIPKVLKAGQTTLEGYLHARYQSSREHKESVDKITNLFVVVVVLK